ncbi:MAG: carboxypeptidase-like regulatory domain-containing protein [Cyclobacteriaceae bacterium]
MRIVFTFLLIFSIAGFCIAQDQEREIIQFTGVVFNQDSTSIVPGVHIYIPKSGRGTTTNPYGFFSLPVMEGDSVVLSAVGFKRSFYIIPKHTAESSSMQLIVTLQDDIQFLEEVEIRPYPTEAMFKEALITMELPYEKEYANIYQWMNSEIMRRGYYDLPNSANANHQYFVQQQFQGYINRYSPPQNQLLNPFAWANFINSLKRKKK